jgi:hypothetical protein
LLFSCAMSSRSAGAEGMESALTMGCCFTRVARIVQPSTGCAGRCRTGKGVRSEAAGRRNWPTPSLPTPFLQMAIQRPKLKPRLRTKLAAAHTAAHEFRHPLLNVSACTSLGHYHHLFCGHRTA